MKNTKSYYNFLPGVTCVGPGMRIRLYIEPDCFDNVDTNTIIDEAVSLLQAEIDKGFEPRLSIVVENAIHDWSITSENCGGCVYTSEGSSFFMNVLHIINEIQCNLHSADIWLYTNADVLKHKGTIQDIMWILRDNIHIVDGEVIDDFDYEYRKEGCNCITSSNQKIWTSVHIGDFSSYGDDNDDFLYNRCHAIKDVTRRYVPEL